MKKELMILLSFIFTMISCTSAQQTSLKKLEGTLVEKPWTKSTQSYCAQGSEYLVLKTKEKEFVLAYDETLLADLQTYKNKQIVLEGEFQTKEIVNDDPYSQKPVSYSLDKNGNVVNENNTFTCEVFKVNKVVK